MAEEQLDTKEKEEWAKAVERVKYEKEGNEPELGQKKIVEKLIARGLKATPKKERQADIQTLLPNVKDRK